MFHCMNENFDLFTYLNPYFDHSTANDRVIATIPALAQADGSTNPLPVSAYVVIICKNEAPNYFMIHIKK